MVNKSVYILGVLFLALALMANFAFAAFTMSPTAQMTVNQSQIKIPINFTINVSEAGKENITQVNITLPTGFVYITSSDTTDEAAGFVYASNVLSWENLSMDYLVNRTDNGTFGFNFTAPSTPGGYNFTITALNSSADEYTLLFPIVVNDTVIPYNISFISPTPTGYITSRAISVNLTSTDNAWITATTLNFTVYLLNSTQGRLNYSNPIVSTTTSGVGYAYINFTNATALPDGVYYINASVRDADGNVNASSEIREVIIDATVPVLADYVGLTPINGSYIKKSDFIINVTANDSNTINVTTNVYNSTGLVTSSNWLNSSSGTFWFNVTPFITLDGTYYFNATVTDIAGNKNYTITRNITIDSTVPSYVEYGNRTDTDGSYVGRSNIVANISTNDANPVNISVSLFNSTQDLIKYWVLNLSTAGSYKANFTSLADGTYYFNATVTDIAGNKNYTTATRNVTVDAQVLSVANVTIGTPSTSGVTIYYTTNKSINIVNISYGIDSLGSYSALTGVGAASGNVGLTGLTSGSKYNFNITVCDYVGTCASNGTYSFTTATSSSTETPSSPGGGGSSAVDGDVSYWYATFNVYEDQLNKGFTWNLQNHIRVHVIIGGEDHYIGVVGVTNDSVTVNVSSDMQQATIGIGQTKKFDVNGDYIYDLSVKLNSVAGVLPSLTIQGINETMSAADIAAAKAAKETATVSSGNGSQATAGGAGTGAIAVLKNNKLIWIVAAIIVLLAIVGIIYRLYLKKMKRLGYR